MSDLTELEGLQALHRDLVSVCERRFQSLLDLEQLLASNADAFKKLLQKPGRDARSRSAVQSGKITVSGTEYSVNQEFQENALKLADELELDELQAANVLLEASDDQNALGRPLVECGVIRFHQQRKYLLDCVRLCLEIANDVDQEDDLRNGFAAFVSENIYCEPPQGARPDPARQKMAPRCLAEMLSIKAWLQRLTESATAAALLQPGRQGQDTNFEEVLEFSRVSLIQQHELLAVIMCSAIEQQQADVAHFQQFLQMLKKLDRYDHLLVHYISVSGAYITVFGSPEGRHGLREARELNAAICNAAQDDSWTIVYVRALVRAWWIAEYSAWYLDEPPGSPIANVDLDKEDEERSKQFTDALKDGAFDFLLSIAADTKTVDWRDPARSGMRQWLQRLSPPLMTDTIPFSDFFQTALMGRLEVFVDGFISNLPDVLRRLRTEEDEQRQLSQTHEHSLDLERFLLIIAYAYDDRPDAAETFWREPESNLAGFLQWASRRASTPLVSAFCEMLQALSSDEACATAAHQFLLDETHHSQGKMRRTLALTWRQVFKELAFFTNKIRERPTPPQSQIYRGGKVSTEQAETEPESAMMLECYLRLISKLSAESEVARLFLLKDPAFNLVDILFQLASSPIPARLRACAFYALNALISRKTQEEGYIMWRCVDSWMTGGYASVPGPLRPAATAGAQSPTSLMEAIFAELAEGFEEPNSFVRLLIGLVTPAEGYENLHDTLSFPEDLGSAVRMPGIEQYVDYVMGDVFALKSTDVQDRAQLRILRLNCLEFAHVCLATFNEDLIIISNVSNVAVDRAIDTTDLATYVKLHPFARVMEWMFNDKVMDAIFGTIHQDGKEVGNAAPDSPLIQGVLRAVGVITKVLEMQDTFLDLVRPLVKQGSGQRKQPVANAAYSSFEDGIMNHLDLVVDLGRYCAIGYAPLTLACLKLLQMVSASPKLSAAWNAEPGRAGGRSKAVVALEANGDAEAIAASLVSELMVPLDLGQEDKSPNYLIKKAILDFLYASLAGSPDQPTPAHLLLGFKCDVSSLSIPQDGAFDGQYSVFHNIFRLLLELPFGDDLGMRGWLIALKLRAMRIFQALWSSPLSHSLVVQELRSHTFLFLLLVREVVLQPGLAWDGVLASSPEFLFSDGSSVAYVGFLDLRAMLLEYISTELCSASQSRLPSLKRRICDALNGQLTGSDDELISVPNIFDFFDFLPSEGQPELEPPEIKYYRDVDLRCCVSDDASYGPQYDIDRVRQVLQLKRNEARNAGQVIPQNDLSAVEKEEIDLIAYLVGLNRQNQVAASRLLLLRAWTNLVIVLCEANELQAGARVSFLVQALQVVLPSLESYSSAKPAIAMELAKLAQVLLFQLHLGTTRAEMASQSSQEVSGQHFSQLLGDKLFQLFQICLGALGRVPRNPELRSLYYSICCRYLAVIAEGDSSEATLAGMLLAEAKNNSRRRALKQLTVYGERLLTVCDDALTSDTACQTSALIFLGALVHFSGGEDTAHIIETLNSLNFIGILVDSLKTMLQDWLQIVQPASNNAANGPDDRTAKRHCYEARLALLQLLCQTRDGAAHVLHAGLFRAIEQSGLFAADPELAVEAGAGGPADARTLTQHYALLVRVTRIVGAAVLARGASNVVQGRWFLTDHRMLVLQTLKRSAGLGAAIGNGQTHGGRGGLERQREQQQQFAELDERVEELAEAFMVLIIGTGFLEFEEQALKEPERRGTGGLFH